MRWLLFSSLWISAFSLPLHGFPPQPLDIQSEQRDTPSENQPLPVIPGVLRSNSLEPLETTTSDLPPVRESPVPLPPSTPVDKYVDLNGDNELSLSEVQYAAFVHHGLSASVVKNLFDQVDANHDGILTAEEFNNIKPLVSEKAENAAVRYLQSVDTDHNKLLSLAEAQAYILKEYGIGHRDVERIWRLVNYDVTAEMTPAEFSKLRRRIRGMTIRLARQMMKTADVNGDGHISLDEAQAIAFEQEGIQSGDAIQMMASVDDNQDGELNAPEFADFERIVRSRAVETSKKALKVVDADGSGTVTMDEAKRIAFEHYGFNEETLGPFFDQADENEDHQLDAVEFAGFRTVIRSRAVKDALVKMIAVDRDGDGLINLEEAAEKTRAEDDLEPHETKVLFNIADQNKSGKLDKVEFADFLRLVRLSAIRFAADHFKEFDRDGDGSVTLPELAGLIQAKYGVPPATTAHFFDEVDVDNSRDLIPAEIVDFRHVIREFVTKNGGGLPNSAENVRSPTMTLQSSGDGEQVVDDDEETTSQSTEQHPTQQPVTRITSLPSREEEEPTTRRKVAYVRKTTTPEPTTTTTEETTTTPTIEEETPTTKRRSVWHHWNRTTPTTSQPPQETTFDDEVRRRIIEEQKKELNIPEDAEVEYLDGDTTTKAAEEYEVVEYEEGNK